MDFFEARYFSGAQGRFTSPDVPLADQREKDPQSWNLYAYVRNNPLRMIDPTGRTCQTASDGTTYDDMDGKGCSTVDEANKNKKPDVTVTASPEPTTWAQFFGFDRDYNRAIAQQLEIEVQARGGWDKIPILRGEIPVGPPAHRDLELLSSS